jgi:hypothetical protein
VPADDRSEPVEQDPVLGDHSDRPGEHQPLHVPADGDQLVGRALVTDPYDVLLDDRALVEIGGYVVRGGSDQLDSPFVCLVIRLGTLETGEK